MRHASLCTGIGGFDLAAEWCGWNNIFQVEKDAACKKVLVKNFNSIEEGVIDFEPTNKSRPILYSDIKQFNGKEWNGKVDIISAGFPCQPFSVAGKQKNKEDDRFLWYEIRRVVQETRPTWFVGENVVGIVKLALDEVCTDLENIGYSVETVIIPACSVGAPHRRERVWILAHSKSERILRRTGEVSESNEEIQSRDENAEPYNSGIMQVSSYSASIGHEKQGKVYGSMYSEPYKEKQTGAIESSGAWDASDTYSSNGQPLCGQQTTSGQQRAEINGVIFYNSGNRIIADSDSIGSLSARRIGEVGRERLGIKDSQNDATYSSYGTKNKKIQSGRNAFTGKTIRTYRNDFENFPTQPPICGRDDGFSNRVDRLKQLGNAIVPQVAYEIFKCIDTIESIRD